MHTLTMRRSNVLYTVIFISLKSEIIYGCLMLLIVMSRTTHTPARIAY